MGRIDILTVLSLLIHEHGICLQLFVFFDFVHQGSIVFSIQDGGGGGREVQEGGDIGIHMADSLHCTAETNTTL